jgi:hypothetical protein
MARKLTFSEKLARKHEIKGNWQLLVLFIATIILLSLAQD